MKNLRKKNHKENYGKYCCLLFPESLEKEIIENYSKTFDQEYLKRSEEHTSETPVTL